VVLLLIQTMDGSEALWFDTGRLSKRSTDIAKDVGKSVLDGTAGRVSKIENREAKMVDKVMATEGWD
jgi:hypothetical protein